MKEKMRLLTSALLWLAVVLLPLFGVLLPARMALLSLLPWALLPRATRQMKRALDRVEMVERSGVRTQSYYNRKF